MHHRSESARLSRPSSVASVFVASAFAVCLAQMVGCSLFDRSDVRGAQYLLAPPKQAKVDGAPLGSISVVRFSALPPYDRRAFLYHATDGSWRGDTFNGFMADPSDMLTEAFSAALARSGRATSVLGEGLSVRGDFSVNGVVERFYADYTDPAGAKAIVHLHIYLLDGRGLHSRLVGEYHGEGAAAIAGKEPGEVAQAFSEAAASAIDQAIRALPESVAIPSDATSTQK